MKKRVLLSSNRINDACLIPLLFFATILISCSLIFTKDPYYGHDIGFHLSRIQSIADCLHNRVFPAVIYPGYLNGYGYANGLFYPDFFLYLPAFLVYLGIDCKLSYHLFIFLINIATLLSMFFCIRKIKTDNLTSCVISCIYTLSSYRFTDLYIRAALGETLSFIFVPFVILGLYEIFYGESKNGWYLTIGLFGVLTSHIITLFFCIVMVFLIVLINVFSFFNNRRLFLHKIGYLALFCIIAVGMTSFFTFPFLEALFSDTYMFQTNPATGGWDRTIPFYLSLLEIPTYQAVFTPVGIGLVFVALSILFFSKYTKQKKSSKHFMALGFVFLLMSTNLFPWKFFNSLVQMIQFPWRFMIMATTCLLFAYAPIVSRYLSEFKSLTVITTCSLILFTVLCFFYNIFIINDYKQYTDEVHYSLGGVEYAPSGIDLSELDKSFEYFSNNALFVSTIKNGTTIYIDYNGNYYSDSYIEVPLVYYKGYKAIENNQQLTVAKGNNGNVRIYINDTKGSVKVYYGQTALRIIGTIISFISSAFFILYYHSFLKEKK